MSSSNQHGRSRSRRTRSGHSRQRHQGLWQRTTAAFSPNMTAITLLWMATLLLGGSSRPDVIQIAFLRPLAVLAAGFGFWTLEWSHLSRYRFLVGMTATTILLVLLHLLPLPPGLWTALPGRGLIVDLDRGVGLQDGWRPISMAPSFTWNALFSLSVPAAFVVNGIQLKREELPRVAVIFIMGAVVSAILAFLQIFGAPNGSLYPYSIKVVSPEAVGFFANRNHEALLVAATFPLLAAYGARRGIDSREDQRRLVTAFALTVFLLPLLIVGGSRAGLVAGLCGLACTPLIYLSGARVRRGEAPAR